MRARKCSVLDETSACGICVLRYRRNRFPARGFYELDIMGCAEVAQSRGRQAVGDESVNLGYVADPNGCRPIELRLITDKEHAPRIVDNGARDADLAWIIIEEGPIFLESGCADDRDVDFELPDELDRRAADDCAIGAAHQPAGGDHLDGRMSVKRHRHVEVVGDDKKILMVLKRVGYFLGRRADVDEE